MPIIDFLKTNSRKLVKNLGPKALEIGPKIFEIGALVLGAAAMILRLGKDDDSDEEFEDIDNEDDDDFDDDYESNPLRRTTGHPILPIDLWDEIYQRDGEGEANRTSDKVQLGYLSVDDVRKAIKRPSIPPEKWRDFEDGWRPDDWD